MKLFKIVGPLAVVMGLFLMTPFSAAASENVQYEDVIINGYKLGFFEQMALENHIDRDIPDGNYWFEVTTGMWGPVGGTAFGRIEVSDEYREFIESKFSKKQNQVTNVKLSASVAEDCEDSCLYW